MTSVPSAADRKAPPIPNPDRDPLEGLSSEEIAWIEAVLAEGDSYGRVGWDADLRLLKRGWFTRMFDRVLKHV